MSCRVDARWLWAFVLLGLLAPAVALRSQPPVDTSDITGAPATELVRRRVAAADAAALHRQSLVFDGHNDLPFKLRRDFDGDWRKLDLNRHQPELHTDIPRLRAGGVGAQFWSAFVEVETDLPGSALRETLDQVELIHELARHWPEVFEIALTADDVERISRSGKIASLIGVEGGYAIQDSLGPLRQLYRLGVRYMTLTHTETLNWADSATDEARHGGLTEFGEEVVREMNRLGMLVDISHVSADTMRDTLRVARAPVIASHSSTRALANHPRNIDDELLKSIARNGGVVMVNFYSGYIVPAAVLSRAMSLEELERFKAEHPNEDDFEAAIVRWHDRRPTVAGTIEHLVDHIDHIVRVAGIDHVGIGSDFDGVSLTPEGLEDVSCFPKLTKALLDRGYTAEHVQKVMGLNTLRVLREAQEVSRQLGRP